MHGISYDRVEVRSSLTPGAGHLSLYGEIDIALDPFPWNGHVTTLEALWMGVPVVALYGDRHASRMCASALNAASLNHLIATNEDEYIQIVKDLCTDKNNLNEIRTQLRGQVAGSALCDGKSLAREIETAYRVIWKRWCDDQLNS
jgi:protein O-GlcNAc transferase